MNVNECMFYLQESPVKMTELHTYGETLSAKNVPCLLLVESCLDVLQKR